MNNKYDGMGPLGAILYVMILIIFGFVCINILALIIKGINML